LKKEISLLATAGLLMSCVGLCRAESVTYYTSGVYNYDSTSSPILEFGDGTSMTFDPITPTILTVPGDISYGNIDTTGVGLTTETVPAGTTFTLTFTEESPTPTTFTDTATVSGMIDSTFSNIHVDFPTTSFMIGDDTFTIAQPEGGFVIVPPDDDAGLTTINGELTLTVTSGTPEPSTSMLLIGGGLTSLAFLLRRRKKV
jgi:hypothetical protein